MLTLNEIRNVNFRKANFGGYRAEDVEAFIDEVQLSYDTLLRENAELVKKLEVLASRLEEYQSEEDSIRNALMNAQKVGDASLRDAKHKAEIILKDATIKAEKIVSNAQAEIHREREIIERMQRDISEFKAKLLKSYKDHLALINNIPNEDIMRPETKEMVQSVPMIDRRPAPSSYDAPAAPSAPVSEQPMSASRRFGEPAPASNNIYSQATASPASPYARSASFNSDVPAQASAPTASQNFGAHQPSVVTGDRPSQRRGGFTVDIDEAPIPAAPQSRNSRFGATYGDNVNLGEDPAQFSDVTVPSPEQPEAPQESGLPANLFKRRR